MYIYVVCVSEAHRSHKHTLHDIPPSICISGNSDESKKLPDDGRPLPKHVRACILNKGVVKFSACVGCFR
jgi:hypothetical protein